MIDLDDFKKINDIHNHHGGDHVLSEVGRILSQSTQKRDCVARWGGEEFLVLLPETELQQAIITAERLRKNIAEMGCIYHGREIRVTLSIGVAEFNKNTTVTEMIKNADHMLYAAKHAGKNLVVAKNVST
jgi:diguanylate cyclase (GGDEF)-like protein